MTHKLPRFAQLWQRVKDTWNAKPAKLIEIQPGEIAVVFESVDAYNCMMHGLSDAATYTGINYAKKVYKKSTTIAN